MWGRLSGRAAVQLWLRRGAARTRDLRPGMRVELMIIISGRGGQGCQPATCLCKQKGTAQHRLSAQFASLRDTCHCFLNHAPPRYHRHIRRRSPTSHSSAPTVWHCLRTRQSTAGRRPQRGDARRYKSHKQAALRPCSPSGCSASHLCWQRPPTRSTLHRHRHRKPRRQPTT